VLTLTQSIKLNKIEENVWEIPKSGKMNVPGRIFANEALLSQIRKDRALEQIKNTAHLPGIYKYSIGLPDIHQGYGFSIGGVAALDSEEGGISPGGVGYDINCGVRLLETNLYYENIDESDVRSLTNSIYEKIPAGVGRGRSNISPKELDDILTHGANWAKDQGYAEEKDLLHTEDKGNLEGNPSKVSEKAKARGRPQVGSLGAGNHFLEIQRVDQNFDEKIAKTFGLDEGKITVMIHCGSRGLGHQVASDYLRTMDRKFKNLVNTLPDRQLLYAPAQSSLAKDYLFAMNSAANYAFTNRQLIAYHVREAFQEIFPEAELSQVYDVCHNIAKLETHNIDGINRQVYVHRKGATRSIPKEHPLVPTAYKNVGQPVLLPGTMGTSSYVLVGTQTAIDLTFGSTAHGAGRLMSRKRASNTYRVDQVKNNLRKNHIYIRAHSNRCVIEEAPGAYKNVDDVVQVSHDIGIGQKVTKLVPLGVVKG
jgi:tRNA-splicing ligase RtcB